MLEGQTQRTNAAVELSVGHGKETSYVDAGGRAAKRDTMMNEIIVIFVVHFLINIINTTVLRGTVTCGWEFQEIQLRFGLIAEF